MICMVGTYVFATEVGMEDIPPPNFSNSIAFNDKLSFIQNKKADIISIGSSMTLNNLHSTSVVKQFNSDSYLNLSSWGICMKDIYLLFKTYTQFHKPKICIVSSNLVDFEKKNIQINYENILDYISSSDNSLIHFKKFNASYYANNSIKIKEYKHHKDIYEYLGYDQFGAVLFDPSNFKISKTRWLKPGFSKPQEQQYQYLDSLSLYCKLNNIELHFFHSPYREGMYKASLLDTSTIKKHILRVNSILTHRDQHIANANDVTWADTLFVDALHFNNKGAQMYSEYCFTHENKSTVMMNNILPDN